MNVSVSDILYIEEFGHEETERPLMNCYYCDEELYGGDEVVIYDKKTFCSEECMIEHILEELDYRKTTL